MLGKVEDRGDKGCDCGQFWHVSDARVETANLYLVG